METRTGLTTVSYIGKWEVNQSKDIYNIHIHIYSCKTSFTIWGGIPTIMDPTIIQHLSRSAGKPMVIKCPHFIPFQKSLILRNQWYPLSGQSHSRKSGRRRRAPCHYLPVIPHKAVAEVLKIDNYRRGELF